MANVGDHLQIKCFQTMPNVSGDILNVFYFEITAMASPQPLASIAGDLRNWYQDTFSVPQRGMQTSNILHTKIEVNNLENFDTDFAIVSLDPGITGSVVDVFSSSVATWSFQLTRTLRTTRNGRKGIAGLPEAWANNNLPSVEATSASTTVIDMWSNPEPIDLTAGGTISIIPVIAKTPVPPATIPTVFNPVSGVIFRGIGSQTTRKQLLS